jgi:hypothetical protein
MNKCRFFKELSSYLDNQLSEERKLEVQAHIHSCKLCSDELSGLKLLSERLKQWQAPDLGSEFDNVLTKKIVLGEIERGEVKMKKKTLAVLIPSGAIAGILVFIFFAHLYVMRGMQGRLRSASDDVGEVVSTQRYEPYYQGRTSSSLASRKDYAVARKTGNENAKAELGYSSGYTNERAFSFSMPEESQSTPAAYKAHESVERLALRSGAEGGTYGASGPGEGSVIVIQPVLPATGEGERIIRTAEVRVEVEDGKETYKKASLVCQEYGGYLAASNFYKDSEGREAGTITMRIPKDKFLTVLDKLNTLGKLINISTNSQDVSQEYANLKTQLDTTMIVYNKMLEALQKRQVTIPDAVRLESELTPVRQRIEDLKNKIEYLNNAVSFTTITLHFYESEVSAKVLKESKGFIQKGIITAQINAVKLLANTIKAIPTLILMLVWLAVLFGVILLIKHLITKLFKRK